MYFIRPILAIMISLSVALLPMAGLAAVVVSPAAQDVAAVASPKMAMPSHMAAATDDCCSDEANTKSCDQCPIASCAAQPMSSAPAAGFPLYVVVAASLLPIPADQVVSLSRGSPPFRPPRV
ncbi:hypothetical protein ES707_05827 [subsurface metagenome]